MKNKLLYPIKALKASYLPLLAVYFSVGLAVMTDITTIFFIKDRLSLSAADLTAIAIWTNLPWSIKMVFGSIIDSVKIFGSNRKAYIYIGAILIAIGTLGRIDHTTTQYIFGFMGEYVGLVITGLLKTIGIVLADIVADTIAIEVTEDKKELGEIQVLARLFYTIGGVVGTGLSGYLANTFSPYLVYIMSLICPLLAIIGTGLTKKVKDVATTPMNYQVLTGGLIFGLLSIFSGSISKEYGTSIMFVLASGIMIYLFKDLLRSIDPSAKRTFLFSMIALFLFRLTPSTGSGISWYYMDVLGLDEIFMGRIAFIGSLTALLSLWFLMETVSDSDIFKTLTVLVIVGTALSLPDILVYYNLTGSIPAKYIILMNGAIASPIANLAMVPLGVIIAQNAPKNQKATYITVTAGMMNLALVGGNVVTELLNRVFVVTRGSYGELGIIMIYALTISTVLSILGLVLLKRSKI